MSAPMEFWGVEVKAGQPLTVNPGEGKIIHLSQASLGESKNKGSESVPTIVKFGGQKLILGTLSSEHFPQINFDLIFEKEFELSHKWKHGSVFFCGYSTILHEGDEHSGESDDELSEEDIPLTATGNGNAEAKKPTAVANAAAKSVSSAKKVTISEPAKMEVDSEDEDDDSDEDEEKDSEDDSEDESDSDEETPKKAEVGKKRPSGSAAKTPVNNKKAKVSTPQKTDGKKGSGHTDTPYPKKKDAKATPAAASSKDAGKSKQEQTPGHVICNTCSKTFKSDGALQSHSKAKHSATK